MTEETLFHEALAKPAAERAAFLDAACAGRPELRAAVEALLAAHEASGELLDRPAAELGQTVDSGPGGEPPLATGEYTPQPQEQPAHPTTTDYQPKIEPGGVIAGRYTLVEKLGEGGMGEVWVAKQTEPVKRKVALKLIKTGMDSRAVLARFEQERQALALMDHPNIARVLDGGMTPTGQPFFVMDLVNGLPLTKFCDEAKLTPKERLELFVPICQAVQHAHQKGIVHRDLKPANILVTLIDGRPVPKVIDFGVAKATAGKLTDESMSTQFGAVVGTLEYMSPEQAGFSGQDIDTRADIYSLGVILYELLTGLRPIDAKRLQRAALTEMICIIREEEPSKPSTRLSTDESLPSLAALRQTEPRKLMALLRGELDWVVMKCLEKQRDRRYETANALSRDIQRYLSDEPVEARPPSFRYRAGKFLRRNKGPVIAGSLVFLTLIAGTVGTTIGLFRAEEQRNVAVEAQKAEAARAEGERLAKLEAQEQKAQAEAARDKEAKERGYAEAIANFVKDDFLALTSVKGQQQFGGDKLSKNATLRDLLERAAKKLKDRKDLDPRTEAELNWMIGVSYRLSGDASLGISYLERAAELRRQTLGPSDESTLNAQNSLAVAYRAAGLVDKALPLFEETYRLTKERLGPDAEQTLLAGRNLASGYADARKDDLALPLVEETLRLMRSKLGPDHEQTLRALQTQANVYWHKGNTKEAVALLEEALKLAKPRHGADRSITYEIMNGLAVLYLETGQTSLAVPLLEEILKIAKARLEPDHPDILTITGNLADAYGSVGNPDLEMAMKKELLDLLKAKLGPDHPQTIAEMNNLGTAYLYARKVDQALPLLEEVVKHTTVKLGPNNPTTRIAINNLASAYKMAGKVDKAIPLFEESLKISKAKLGPDHFDTLRHMLNLGSAYREAGKLDRSVELLEETLMRMNAKLGPDHPATLACTNNLARTYMAADQDAKLMKLLPDFLPKVRKVLATDRRQLSGMLAEFGTFLVKHKKWTEAEPLIRECLAIRQSQMPDDWRTFNAKSLFGGVLLSQKKYAEAEPLLLAGFEGMKKREAKIPPPAKVRMAEAVERVLQLYEATGKKEEAAKWRKELEAIQAARKKTGNKP